jgi:glycosyltransferase involved in cell wall biosynthesis
VLVANGLADRGFAVEIVVLRDDGPIRDIVSSSVSVHVLNANEEQPRGDQMKAAKPTIAAYIRERSPRLLHAPGNHIIRTAADAIKQAGQDCLFVAKVTNPLLGSSGGWIRRYKRRLTFGRALRRADKVLVLSQWGVDEVAGIDPSLRPRTKMVHNPYVTDSMLGGHRQRCETSPPVILSVGRLSKQKNHALLLNAAARLKTRKWRIRLCGVGPEEASLRALAAHLGIADQVHFVGFVDDPTPEYLAASVFALTSEWEGLPATVLEAIACGCAIVATASSPGLVSLLNEIGAEPPIATGDEEAFASALEQALAGDLPALNREAARPYEVEASLDEHALLFGSLLGGQKLVF